MGAGAEHGIEPGGYRVLESLRMEKGYRYMGTDISAGDTPYEAGLGFCVALDKGDFVGRDALARAAEGPPQRVLRTLVVGGEDSLPLYGGEAVRLGGQTVGRVRSCAYGLHRAPQHRLRLPAGRHHGGRAARGRGAGRARRGRGGGDVLYDPAHERVRG